MFSFKVRVSPPILPPHRLCRPGLLAIPLTPPPTTAQPTIRESRFCRRVLCCCAWGQHDVFVYSIYKLTQLSVTDTQLQCEDQGPIFAAFIFVHSNSRLGLLVLCKFPCTVNNNSFLIQVCGDERWKWNVAHENCVGKDGTHRLTF